MKKCFFALVLPLALLLTACGREPRPAALLLGQAADLDESETLLVIDGQSIPAWEYLYWLALDCRQMEERFMMIEELMQEEFQAGKEEGRTEGKLETLVTNVTNILSIRNLLTDSIKKLVTQTTDTDVLQKMLESAVVCTSTDEFLETFKK